MGLELLVNVQMLAPEKFALVLAGGNFVTLDEFGRNNQLVSHELLNIEDEGPVLLNTILNIAVKANHI